jgi:hypothetical protein
MKSALRQDIGADLISFEAKSREFHPSSLGFHRGKATISLLLNSSTNQKALMRSNQLDFISALFLFREHQS